MQSDEPDAHEKTRPNAGDSVLQVDQSGTVDASSPDAALSASIPATAKSFAAGFAAALNGTIIDNPHAGDRYPWQQQWSATFERTYFWNSGTGESRWEI